MVAGRSTEVRTVASVATTSTSTAITAPANSFNEEDAGRAISGTGIPTGATLATVTSDTAAVLSAAATATGTISAAIGSTGGLVAGNTYGFHGWSPETDAESETYSVSAVNAGTVTPDRITSNVAPRAAQRGRG